VPPLPRRSIHLPAPGTKRATVVGAGSFGTAVAVLLARGGFRTTLQTRTKEQAQRLTEDRENRVYLSGVELPRELRVEPLEAGLARADYVLLGVPSTGLDKVIESLEDHGLPAKAAVVSLAKGLVPPDGTPPTELLRRRFGASRTAYIGGPAHAREMVSARAGLVAASTEESVTTALAQLILGELLLADWVAVGRTTVPRPRAGAPRFARASGGRFAHEPERRFHLHRHRHRHRDPHKDDLRQTTPDVYEH
jgi:glycerol-3-phosphate dehydrogenase (NAD(P)+)